MRLKLGIALWNQVTSWPEVAQAARHLDVLGYDHIWTWDHVYASSGDPYQPVFDGPTLLAAIAAVTQRAELGLLVGANSLRNPALVAKAAVTLDHISGGRAILGLGAGWFQLEHEAYGVEFGASVGQRIDWLDEACGAIRALLAGQPVTSPPEGHYRFRDLRLNPRPVRAHVPLMIGGAGERRTLRVVAKHADLWNLYATPDELRRKDGVLREHCAAVGRDEAEIERTIGVKIVIRDDPTEARDVYRRQLLANTAPLERLNSPSAWVGSPQDVAARVAASAAAGFRTVIVEMPNPYDHETFERLIGEVKPMVEDSAT